MVKNRHFLILLFLFLVTVESAVTLYFLVSIPADAKNISFLGFSTLRLIFMGGVTMIFLGALLLFVFLFRSPEKSDSAVKSIDTFFENSNKQTILLSASLFFAGLGILFLLLPAEKLNDSFIQRILPLVLLAMVVALQVLFGWFLWVGKKLRFGQLEKWKHPIAVSGFILLLFILLWTGIAWSGIGIKREASGWLSPGTPVLAQQVLFAWAIGMGVVLLGKIFEQNKKTGLMIGFFLWLTASLVWWLTPMLRVSYFAPTPTAPNFEYYPYSDAAAYDEFAQNILIGASRQMGLTHRPLYSILLALLHKFDGYGFQNTLLMQVAILAFIPVIGYLLAARIGGRPAGVMTALLLIFREKNSISFTNVIEVSHVKLLMSDVPTMLFMLLFIYIYVKWLQDKQNRLVLGVLAGVCFGLVVFIRSQSQLLIPIALLGILLSQKFTWKSFFQKVFVFLFGAVVVLAPWVWRNYQLSGKAVVEYQEFYTRIIAVSYTSSPNDILKLPAETVQQYDARMKDQIINFILHNPLEVARFYSSYFLHNEVATLAYLPMSLKFNDIYDYVDIQGFWDAPYLGEMPARTWPALFFILCLIALGIGTAFHRHRWVAIMPLLFHLGYSFSVAPVKQSGWRFILPVDWVSILYFSVGLMQLSLLIFSFFSEKNEFQIEQTEEPYVNHLDWKGAVPLLVVFAIFGLSLPLLEWGIPQTYPKISNSELIQLYVPDGIALDDGKHISATSLESFLATEPDAVITYGRALYPSYYTKGAFWGEASPDLLEASQFDRLQFKLIGSYQTLVYIPVQDVPQYLPHASDVFVVGCKQNYSIRALIIKVNDQVLTSSPWKDLTCSGTE